jgi:hypothetical protein
MKTTLTFLSLALGLAVAAPTFAQDRRSYEAPPVHTEVVVRRDYGPGQYSRLDERRHERAELRREWAERRARIAARMHARMLENQARRERHYAASGRMYGGY